MKNKLKVLRAERDWSQEMLEKLGINPQWLPKTFEGTAVTGQLTADAAQATGLPVGTPVMAWSWT